MGDDERMYSVMAQALEEQERLARDAIIKVTETAMMAAGGA